MAKIWNRSNFFVNGEVGNRLNGIRETEIYSSYISGFLILILLIIYFKRNYLQNSYKKKLCPIFS